MKRSIGDTILDAVAGDRPLANGFGAICRGRRAEGNARSWQSPT